MRDGFGGPRTCTLITSFPKPRPPLPDNYQLYVSLNVFICEFVVFVIRVIKRVFVCFLFNQFSALDLLILSVVFVLLVLSPWFLVVVLVVVFAVLVMFVVLVLVFPSDQARCVQKVL